MITDREFSSSLSTPDPDPTKPARSDRRWQRFSSRSHGLSFHFPIGWGISRQGNYLFLSDRSEDNRHQLVLDLNPIHLYPYSDVSEYMDKACEQETANGEIEIRSLPGGYQASRVHRAATAGREFNLFYIGKGNMAYTLTANSMELLKTADEIISSIRFV